MLAYCVMAYYNVIPIAIFKSYSAFSSLILLAHLPTLCIVTLFFRTTWLPLLYQCHRRYRLIMHLIMFTVIADSITVCGYLLLKVIPLSIPLSLGFIGTALLLISLRWCSANRTHVQVRHMVVLGCLQTIALLPGISRFGIVYVGARWLGIRSVKAFNIACMLQWPLMVGGICIGLIKPIDESLLSQLLFIVIASAGAYGGLYSVYYMAKKNILWRVSIYMLIPIILAYIIRC